MCLWSYQYFSQCSHQELALDQLCSQSHSIDHVQWTGQEEDCRTGDRCSTSQGSRDQSPVSTNVVDSSHLHRLLPSIIIKSSSVDEQHTILRKSSCQHHHSSNDTQDPSKSTTTAMHKSQNHSERLVIDNDSIDDVEAELQKLTEEVRRLRKQQSSESAGDSDREGSVIHTSRPSHSGLKASTTTNQKSVKDGLQAATLRSKPSNYASPTAASQRRAAATVSTSPKPVRTIPSVKTLWARPVLKTDPGVAHEPEAPASPSRLPRPVARKFSRAELLAIKAVDDQKEEIIDKISSSEVPDLIVHEKTTTIAIDPWSATEDPQTPAPGLVTSLRADAPDFVPMSRDRGLSDVSLTDPGTLSTASPSASPIVLDPQGNVLSPRPTWSWTKRRTVKTLRGLGRAPLPTFDLPATGPSNNSSGGSSPLKAWTVGSDRGPWYGWSGGDGKEISFRGYGPHAERSPYSPHNFRNYENQYGHSGYHKLVSLD